MQAMFKILEFYEQLEFMFYFLHFSQDLPHFKSDYIVGSLGETNAKEV